jgi:hypothetical protein
LAKDLGMTVKQLLTGRPGPLTNTEYQQWHYYYMAVAEEQKREAQRNR